MTDYWQKSFSVYNHLGYEDSTILQKSSRLIKRQTYFEGIAMYGHEMLMSLQNASKVLWYTSNYMYVSYTY
jgi:hypothetical protein